MFTKQPKTKQERKVKKQPMTKRKPSWFMVVFVALFLAVSWQFWGGRWFFGPSIKLAIDSSIDQDDARVDYSVLHIATKEVGSRISLPQKITLHIRECGEANAYYEIGSREVILCDELIDDFVTIFSQVYDNPVDVRDASTNALVFIAFHELGHAFIDVLDIPFTGKEEDVADQLSAYILISTFEYGAQYVLDGAMWFGVTSEQYDIEESDFADDHSLDVQRYYTLACWVYGSDPSRFAQTVFEGGLTRERAATCEAEFDRFSHNWEVLLVDYLK